MPRPGKKRLTIDIPLLMHEQLREEAKKQGITMTDLVKWLLQEFINRMQNVQS